MNDFISLVLRKPPAPGRYWTRRDIRRETLAGGVVKITYTQEWRAWDGSTWDGDEPEPTHFYGEAQREVVQ